MRKIQKISCASPRKDIAQNVSLFEIGYICKLKLGNTNYMSSDMRFPTMWYVRPAKPQISLHIRAV